MEQEIFHRRGGEVIKHCRKCAGSMVCADNGSDDACLTTPQLENDADREAVDARTKEPGEHEE